MSLGSTAQAEEEIVRPGIRPLSLPDSHLSEGVRNADGASRAVVHRRHREGKVPVDTAPPDNAGAAKAVSGAAKAAVDAAKTAAVAAKAAADAAKSAADSVKAMADAAHQATPSTLSDEGAGAMAHSFRHITTQHPFAYLATLLLAAAVFVAGLVFVLGRKARHRPAKSGKKSAARAPTVVGAESQLTASIGHVLQIERVARTRASKTSQRAPDGPEKVEAVVPRDFPGTGFIAHVGRDVVLQSGAGAGALPQRPVSGSAEGGVKDAGRGFGRADAGGTGDSQDKDLAGATGPVGQVTATQVDSKALMGEATHARGRMAKKCVYCGHVNQDSALRCVCGGDLDKAEEVDSSGGGGLAANTTKDGTHPGAEEADSHQAASRASRATRRFVTLLVVGILLMLAGKALLDSASKPWTSIISGGKMAQFSAAEAVELYRGLISKGHVGLADSYSEAQAGAEIAQLKRFAAWTLGIIGALLVVLGCGLYLRLRTRVRGVPPAGCSPPEATAPRSKVALFVGFGLLAAAIFGAGVLALLTRSDASAPEPDPPQSVPPVPEWAGGCAANQVPIPSGTFLMGDDALEAGPVHQVTLSAYCIDKTEVTVAAFRDCVQSDHCQPPVQANVERKGFRPEDTTKLNQLCTWGKSGLDEHPINCVDWRQAAAYCKWAGNRLPTEAEWEYAARDADARDYPWGNEAPGADRLNACGSEGVSIAKQLFGVTLTITPMYTGDDGWPATAPVGSYPKGASPFGILDMAGNVLEWTADSFVDYSARPATNPQRSGTGGSPRVVRGGSWSHFDPARVRAAGRGGYGPDRRDISLGFRCARGVNM